jgi:hypothetical protein
MVLRINMKSQGEYRCSHQQRGANFFGIHKRNQTATVCHHNNKNHAGGIMSERARKIVKIAIYAALAVGVVLLCGGYSFIKRQYAIAQCAPIEQKMLEHIGITEEECLPLEQIAAVIDEYEKKGLGPLEMSEKMIALRDTLLSRELFGIDKADARASCEYSANSKSISFTVVDGSDLLIDGNKISYSWSVLYVYSAEGLVQKIISARNEVIGYMAVSLHRGNISLGYDSVVNLPDQRISLEDYNLYMQARAEGEIAKTQRLSFKNILRYVNKPINTISDN